jgi:hypothetical protein
MYISNMKTNLTAVMNVMIQMNNRQHDSFYTAVMINTTNTYDGYFNLTTVKQDVADTYIYLLTKQLSVLGTTVYSNTDKIL